MYYAARELLLCLRIDDPLEAAPVHFFGGMWGLFCIGTPPVPQYRALQATC